MENIITQKENFLRMLAQIQQQQDIIIAIKTYRRILNLNDNIDPVVYQNLIIRFSNLLRKKELFGEELYYRLSVRYLVDSAMKINSSIIRQSVILDLYSNIVLELKTNSNRLNILILCSDLNHYQFLVDVVKSTCEQQVIFYQSLESLLQISDRFMENYDILLVCDWNRNNQTATVNFFREFKNKFSHQLLTAVYCRNGDAARDYYLSYNQQINYFLYCEKMIFALLHMALSQKNNPCYRDN